MSKRVIIIKRKKTENFCNILGKDGILISEENREFLTDYIRNINDRAEKWTVNFQYVLDSIYHTEYLIKEIGLNKSDVIGIETDNYGYAPASNTYRNGVISSYFITKLTKKGWALIKYEKTQLRPKDTKADRTYLVLNDAQIAKSEKKLEAKKAKQEEAKRKLKLKEKLKKKADAAKAKKAPKTVAYQVSEAGILFAGSGDYKQFFIEEMANDECINSYYVRVKFDYKDQPVSIICGKFNHPAVLDAVKKFVTKS